MIERGGAACARARSSRPAPAAPQSAPRARRRFERMRKARPNGRVVEGEQAMVTLPLEGARWSSSGIGKQRPLPSASRVRAREFIHVRKARPCCLELGSGAVDLGAESVPLECPPRRDLEVDKEAL